MGLPLHPLVIHAAVVFIPLLVLVALGYALVPRLRSHLGWVAVVLAVVAPLSALAAKITGDAFRARLARITPNARFDLIDEHRSLGTLTLYVTIVLGLLTLALVLIRRRPAVLNALLVIAIVLASAATGYYVFRSGDTAARIVWTGF